MLKLMISLLFCVLYVRSQNNFAKLQCEQFDNDETSCNDHQFFIDGFGSAGCTYVPLTSLVGDNPEDPNLEYVCLPDHCGLFVNNETRCQDDIYCSWESDINNLRSNIQRCYPVCFNKLDIMFLVDGSISTTSTTNSDGKTPFELNLEAIQTFVRDNIPDSGEYNDIYDVREYFLSFGSRDDTINFPLTSTLNFTSSESLNQLEISELALLLEAPGVNTNIRRALIESYFLFLENTKYDYQRILFIFSDGSPTEESYLEDDYPQFNYLDHSNDTIRQSLGYIGCEDIDGDDRCKPYQYYDLAKLLWDPLNVYYYWLLLGNEIQTFASGEVNGPLFAKSFVVDDTTDLMQINNSNFSSFINTISASTLSRNIDASICSRITNSPTTNPTTGFSPPGVNDTDVNSQSEAPTNVPSINPTQTASPTMDLLAFLNSEQAECNTDCQSCTRPVRQTICQSCCSDVYTARFNRYSPDFTATPNYERISNQFDRCFTNNCN